MDIEDAFAEAKLPERTVLVCLRLDLVARMEQLDRELVAAKRRGDDDSLASGSRQRELSEQLEALTAEMNDKSVRFTLRALGRRPYRKLRDKHPPREDNDADRIAGFNQDTFHEALLRASVVDPDLDDAQWRRFLDEMITQGQYETLYLTAMSLNHRDVDVPFSPTASKILRSTEPG